MNMGFPALKKCLPAFLGLSLLAAATVSTAATPKMGALVADYMMATWPNLDDATCGSNCFSLGYTTVPATPVPKYWEYTNGIPLVGVWKQYEKTGNVKYFNYVKKWVDTFIDANGNIDYTRPLPVGSLPSDPTIQDVIQPSMLLFGLYEKTKDPRYLTAMKNQRAVFNTIQKNPQGAFWHKPSYPNQQWLDGIYMAEPFLAKYGRLYAEKAIPGDSAVAFNTVVSQIKLVEQFTFVPTKNLYLHAWNGATDGVWLGLDYTKGKTPPLTGDVTTPVLWSRSIAWLYLGVIDVLDDLPKNHPDRDRLRQIVKNISLALEKYQDKNTGLWNQIIDVTNTTLPAIGGYRTETPLVAALPNWNETSASALFAYGLAKANRTGILAPHYREIANVAWAGVKKQITVAGSSVKIHGTVVGMSVGGTYNAYVNADFRTDNATGPLPAPADQCAPATFTKFKSVPTACRYLYVRDNVPQAFGAVLLAASELE